MYTEYGKIRPVIAGELTYTDRFGATRIPEGIYFGTGSGEDEPRGLGYAVTRDDLYGDDLLPVRKSSGESLVFEGFSGLLCRYDSTTGTLDSFTEP